MDLDHIKKAKEKYLEILKREEKSNAFVKAALNDQYIICKVENIYIKAIWIEV